jgi:hypothetical protein
LKALPDCPSSEGYFPPVIFNNCFGTVREEGGGRYVGEWRDGKYNGQGPKILETKVQHWMPLYCKGNHMRQVLPINRLDASALVTIEILIAV